MEPSELAEEVKDVLLRAVSRVGPDSIGAQQYHEVGKPQKFETITLADLKQMYLEEFEDIVNYAVMAHIRVRRLFEDLEALYNAAGSDIPTESSGVQRGDDVPPGPTTFAPYGQV